MSVSTAHKKTTTIKKKKSVSFGLVFPLLFMYYEILFKISTTKHLFSIGTLFMILFCFIYGSICSLLTTISKNEKTNHIVSAVFMGVLPIPFLVEHFVYREFKIFYDWNTVSNAAGDAAVDFRKEIMSLIFSFNGISRIILFFLPLVLFLRFGKKYLPARQFTLKRRIYTVEAIIACFAICLAGLKFAKIGPKYYEEYTFQDATANFGLITSVRLDITHKDKDDDFDLGVNSNPYQPGSPVVTGTSVSGVTDANGSPEMTTTTATTVAYPLNTLNIDFASLADKTSNKTLANLDRYVASLTPSSQNKYTGLFKGKNFIMITAEAFSAEVIDPVRTPTLYRLANKGIQFTDYYQPASAGTTGGEYQNIFGLLPFSSGSSFKKAVQNNFDLLISKQLNALGYYGKAFHNNTYTYYGRDQTHTKLGYSDGFMGYGNGMENYVQKQWPQSDLEMFQGTVPLYIDKAPFDIYYMSVSGHGGYGQNSNAMSKKNWDTVSSLPYSETVKGYLASNMELEYALAYLVSALEEKGIADDTVICIGADHFPYGLDNDAALGNMPFLSELYGYSVNNYIQRDHNRLIIWSGCLEKMDPIVVSSPTSSLDILPTLSNLFGLQFDSRLMVGRDALSDAEAIYFNSGYDWKTDMGYYISAQAKFYPANDSVNVGQDYIDRIKKIVSNKMNFSNSVPKNNYYAHAFAAMS